jgi:tetratricopeptide (TPR) repeat protein
MLMGCEIRASAPGFVAGTVRLYDLPVGGGDVNVGKVVIDRVDKGDGKTLNAAAYRAPKDAVKAYEKAMSAVRSQKYAEAEKWLEKAVQIYPQYSSALYDLGVVRQKTNDKDGAKAAFTQAAETDKKFMAPWLKLAEIAYKAQEWPEVLRLTEHIIELDPMGRTNTTGYVLDLDPVNTGEAYFFNAMANYQLGKIEAAEKSALKAEHVDLLTRFPQLHLLMAEIYSQKGNYGSAIAEMETYIELVPGAKDAEPIKTRLAKLEELNGKPAEQKIENRN